MTLGELIATLEKERPEKVVTAGFNNPHSYRGFYDELAFEPAMGVTVASMLECARSALGQTYQGWKGGDFTMNEYTPVHLANRGECGEEITTMGLAFMLQSASPPAAAFPEGAPGPYRAFEYDDFTILDAERKPFAIAWRLRDRDFILRKVNAPAAPVVLTESERADIISLSREPDDEPRPHPDAVISMTLVVVNEKIARAGGE